MKNKQININTKKVGGFLKSLTEAERIYLGHTFNLSNNIRKLIKKFNLTKQQVCEKYGIKLNKYNDFVSGNCNYDLSAMARTNAWFMELETEALKDEVPVQFAGEKERLEKLKSK